MIGLDTNLVVRLLVEDDADQLAMVHEVIAEAVYNQETCLLTDIVLCELEWVLGSAYKVPRARLLEMIQRLVAEAVFRVEDSGRLRRALDAYAGGKGDLADYLLGETGAELGARTTFTFDRALGGHSAFTVLGGR